MKKLFILIFLSSNLFLTAQEKEIINQDLSDSVKWALFKSISFNFELEYPRNWDAIEAKPRTTNKADWAGNILFDEEFQKVTFLEKEPKMWPGEVQVIVHKNPNQLTLEEWVIENEPQDVTGGSLIQSEIDTNLAGINAILQSIFGFDQEIISIVAGYKDRIYVITYSGENPNDPDIEDHRKIYEYMFASFRFLE